MIKRKHVFYFEQRDKEIHAQKKRIVFYLGFSFDFTE